jgi:aryl-alcohol dehydrogenase-like predicted oxidoreductase
VRYRRLGSTAIEVSEIGFGCGNTAGLMSLGEHRDQLRAAQYAIDRGVNFFDTATTYGHSEENLGRVLPKLSERPVIATKVDITEADLECADIAGAIRRSVDGSLRRLGVDCLDVVQLHNRVRTHRLGRWPGRNPPLTPGELTGTGGVQEAFQSLQQDGKLRYFGFCASDSDPAAAHQVLAEGAFHSVLVYYNILNPSADRAMPAGFARDDYAAIMARASAQGLGTVVLRALDGGALSGDRQLHPMNLSEMHSKDAYAATAARARQLVFLKHTPDETLAQVAIRFTLQSTNVSTVLIGFSDTTQIDEAIACSGRPGLSVEQLALLEGFYSGGAA